MKVICNRGALLEAVSVTGNVVATRTPKPILQCVRLAAEGQELSISATDLEVSIRYTDSQVEIQEPGEVLVPADKLRDIVRESIDDTLAIESEGEMVRVKGQDSLFKVYTQSAEAFPPVDTFSGEADFQVPGGLLKQLVSQTLFAAAKTSSRYAFNGVMLQLKGKTLTLVATDGHRLALAKGEVGSAGKSEPKAIVPIKALSLVDRLIDNPEENVLFQITENRITVQAGAATLTSSLVEGQFPPYEDVIPRDGDRRITASTADLLSAVRRASLLSTEESKGVRMSFSRNGLVLSTQSPVAGEATVNFACKYDGPEFDIGFNPLYLMEALKVVNSEEVVFEMTAPNRPGLLKAGNSFQYVIMPVNLQG